MIIFGVTMSSCGLAPEVVSNLKRYSAFVTFVLIFALESLKIRIVNLFDVALICFESSQ